MRIRDWSSDVCSSDLDSNNGIGDLYARLPSMPADVAAQVTAEIDALYGQRPGLAMVNSDKGITNLHVPSDIIVDASMPAMIRDSGRMWNAAGELQGTKALIPDRSEIGRAYGGNPVTN